MAIHAVQVSVAGRASRVLRGEDVYEDDYDKRPLSNAGRTRSYMLSKIIISPLIGGLGLIYHICAVQASLFTPHKTGRWWARMPERTCLLLSRVSALSLCASRAGLPREDACRTRPKGGASGLEIHAFRYEFVRSEQRQPRPCDAPTPQPRGEAGCGRGAARQFNLRSFVGHVRDLSIHVACSSRVRCLRACVGARARGLRTRGHARTRCWHARPRLGFRV